MLTPFPILDAQRAEARLREAGIGLTAQRVIIARLLLGGHCHVTAEQLSARLKRYGAQVSRATIYNTLHLFSGHGLLHEVVIDPQQRYFDTNLEPHHHLFDLDTGTLTDIAAASIEVLGLEAGLAAIPEARVVGVDVIVRIRTSPDAPADRDAGSE